MYLSKIQSITHFLINIVKEKEIWLNKKCQY